MELNEKGEVIIEEKQKGRLMGKLLQRKQEAIVEEPVVVPTKVVEETKQVEEPKQVEKPVEQAQESDKEQVIKLAYAYLNWAELTDLAKLKVADVEKENASLTVLLKQTVLAQENKEQKNE